MNPLDRSAASAARECDGLPLAMTQWKQTPTPGNSSAIHIVTEPGESWVATAAGEHAPLIVAAPRMAYSLERCEFLLRRIAVGDHQAVQNGLDAAEEAKATLADAGVATRE